MKTLGKKNIKYLMIAAAFGVLLAYQNCGKVDFSNPAGTTPDAQNVTSNVPVSVPVNCPSGQVFDGTNCVPTIPGKCSNYVDLNPHPSGNSYLGAFTIPGPDSSYNCYFIHMINAVDAGAGNAINSTNWFTFRTDINARYHTTMNEDPTVLSQINGPVGHANYTPRVIGSTKNPDGSINLGAIASATFTLQGTRQITMAANSAGNIPMAVDNFILLEAMSNTQGNQMVIEGQADVSPWTNPNSPQSGTSPVTVGGTPVQMYTIGNPQGTTIVAPADLVSYMPLNDPVKVQTTGLDCGGQGQITDIYILFQ